MRCELEDFKTGWFGMHLRLRAEEIDRLIGLLQQVKSGELGHFHFWRNSYEDGPGVADIEVNLLMPDEADNMRL